MNNNYPASWHGWALSIAIKPSASGWRFIRSSLKSPRSVMLSSFLFLLRSLETALNPLNRVGSRNSNGKTTWCPSTELGSVSGLLSASKRFWTLVSDPRHFANLQVHLLDRLALLCWVQRADRLLNQGFQEKIRRLLNLTEISLWSSAKQPPNFCIEKQALKIFVIFEISIHSWWCSREHSLWFFLLQ